MSDLDGNPTYGELVNTEPLGNDDHICADLAERVGVTAACEALGVPRSCFYWARAAREQEPDTTRRPKLARALSDAEKRRVRDLLNSERIPPADTTPSILTYGRIPTATPFARRLR